MEILIAIIFILGCLTLFGFFKNLDNKNKKHVNNLELKIKVLEEATKRALVSQEDSDKKRLDTEVKNKTLLAEMKDLQEGVIELESKLGDEREKNKNLISQKKSSETRLGQISEHLVPFLESCPYNPKDMHFMGNPIDYMVFDFDAGAITFLEVKSGNSKASKRQKTIKNIIKNNRVFYEEIRVGARGVKLKRAENE